MRQHAPKQIRRFVPDRVPATIPARFCIWIFGFYGIIQGLVVVAFADTVRFSGPGYAVIRQAPGGMLTWGVVLTFAGVAVLTGSMLRNYAVKTIAMGVISAWNFAFGAGAIAAAVIAPNAGPTGGAAYMVLALVAAVLTVIDEKKR